jgi:hypothetical protein
MSGEAMTGAARQAPGVEFVFREILTDNCFGNDSDRSFQANATNHRSVLTSETNDHGWI